ncbi:MAG TPA: DUF896 domain-containing protein [Atopostipes sp.]|nr:DUF896 domain-containing protein [Atopostipes sp.]
MLPEELVNKINALARKSKEEGLTEEEKEEQKELRKEYLKMIRGQVENHLTSIKVVDEEGNDVTPDKVKDLKNKKNK